MNFSTKGEAPETARLIDEELTEWLRGCFRKAFPDCAEAAQAGRVVQNSRPEFGDFQCADSMQLARVLHLPPRKIAEQVIAGAAFPGVVAKIEVAGAGFINLTLDDAYVAEKALQGCLLPSIGKECTMVIDYSSPNVAKPMHIGHIRSTVIGCAIDRLHRALGYHVVADNHIGDWGTQFGVIIKGYREFVDKEALAKDATDELERIYVKSYAKAKEDPAWMDACRMETVKLQQGDPENRALWQEFIRLSCHSFDSIFERLGVRFDTTRGESYYQEQLGPMVETLEKAGLAHESEGAMIVDLKEAGLDIAIVRKRDGGFNYTTTDLATVATREKDYHPDKIVYVTDERQQLHFKQFFHISRLLHLVPERCRLEHVWFGLMRLPEGTFSTRQGNVIKQAALLDEAHRRALEVVRRNHPDLPDAEADALAEKVGVGAVKYADLSQDPRTLITFTWDKAMSLEGNSGPYLQYAYARIQSVLEKHRAAFPDDNPAEKPLRLGDPIERSLALQIALFPSAVVKAAETYRPCVLADYLYTLAQSYSSFYQRLPFLKAEDGIRESRIRLCSLVGDVLREGLFLLGIEAPARM